MHFTTENQMFGVDEGQLAYVLKNVVSNLQSLEACVQQSDVMSW